MNELREIIDYNFTVDDLKKHCRKLGITPPSRKADVEDAIIKFYEQPRWLEEYYKSLKGYELEYTNLLVQQNFHPIEEEVKKLKEKYNIKDNDYYYSKKEDTLKYSFYGYIPKEFQSILLKLVPPIEIAFKNIISEVNLDEYPMYMINSGDSMDKFDQFIMFVNKNKVKVTEKNNYVTKSGYLKFIKEYLVNDINRRSDMDDIRTSDDTIVFNGIVSLLLASKVIEIKNGYLELGSKYKEYIKLNKIEKAKMLLDEYINSSSNIISEIKRLANYTFRMENPRASLTEVRKYILEYIKKMPINEWIETEDLFYMVRIKDIYFLRKYVGNVEYRSDYENWYFNASFAMFDLQVVDSMLMDFLAVLGIVDITINYTYTEYGDREFVYSHRIRLNEFGAMVLGLIKEKEEDSRIKPLKITEDFKMIIEDSPKRMEYELYFERFLKLEEKNSKRTIFNLDFNGIATSQDLGLDPNEIVTYILKECPDLPKNVFNELLEWTKYIHQITIKTVKILSCPPDVMDKLLKMKKINALIDNDQTSSFIIKKGKEKEVKKLVESGKYLCELKED